MADLWPASSIYFHFLDIYKIKLAYCLNRCPGKNIYFMRLKSICEIYVFARLVKPFITYPNCQMFPFVAYFISNGWIKRSCLPILTNIYFPIAIFHHFCTNFGYIQESMNNSEKYQKKLFSRSRPPNISISRLSRLGSLPPPAVLPLSGFILNLTLNLFCIWHSSIIIKNKTIPTAIVHK